MMIDRIRLCNIYGLNEISFHAQGPHASRCGGEHGPFSRHWENPRLR